MPEIVLELLAEPTFGGGIEGDRYTDSHLGAYPRATVEDSGERLAAYAECFSGVGDAQLERRQAELAKNLSGVRWFVHALGP